MLIYKMYFLIFILFCKSYNVKVQQHSETLAGLSRLESQPRIINGTAATIIESTYVVSIRLKSYDTTFGNGHICGGSLIAHSKVLTAAHCLFNSKSNRYRKIKEFLVVMGTLNRFEWSNSTIVSDVNSLVYMQTFNPHTMVDDVAIMILKTGLPAKPTDFTVVPIALSKTAIPHNVTCQVFGWGKTESSSLSNVLLTANISTISHQVCLAIYGSSLAPGMLCAGRLQGGTDSCQGDSGGPLVYNGKLIGIVSWGDRCAQPNLPGVYVDVHYYYNWILQQNAAFSSTINYILMPVGILISVLNYF